MQKNEIVGSPDPKFSDKMYEIKVNAHTVSHELKILQIIKVLSSKGLWQKVQLKEFYEMAHNAL